LDWERNVALKKFQISFSNAHFRKMLKQKPLMASKFFQILLSHHFITLFIVSFFNSILHFFEMRKNLVLLGKKLISFSNAHFEMQTFEGFKFYSEIISLFCNRLRLQFFVFISHSKLSLSYFFFERKLHKKIWKTNLWRLRILQIFLFNLTLKWMIIFSTDLFFIFISSYDFFFISSFKFL
jgi:hypothetical protein